MVVDLSWPCEDFPVSTWPAARDVDAHFTLLRRALEFEEWWGLDRNDAAGASA